MAGNGMKKVKEECRPSERVTDVSSEKIPAEKNPSTEAKQEPKQRHRKLNPSKEERSSDTEAPAAGSTAADNRKAKAQEGTQETRDKEATKKRRGAPSDKGNSSPAKKKAAATATQEPLKPDAEFTALAALAADSRKFVGAHISAAGGVHNALVNCFNVKGQAFALFLKSQRKWVSPPLAKEAISGFDERCQQLGIDKTMQVLPHGSYLINVANPDKAKQENAYNALLDDLQRCEKLGIMLYNIHPGSTVGECSKEEGIRNIAAAVNKAHRDTKFVVVVLENMAGQKNVVGSKFEDLRDIIKLVENKDRVGVCLDTCHLFAAGYDIRTAEKFEKVMEEFDRIVGHKYLRGMHLNDSKSELSSALDRHELLGKGHLGLEPFKYIMQHPTRFRDMPLVLETPDPTEGSIWKKEIKQLYGFLEKRTGR